MVSNMTIILKIIMTIFIKLEEDPYNIKSMLLQSGWIEATIRGDNVAYYKIVTTILFIILKPVCPWTNVWG